MAERLFKVTDPDGEAWHGGRLDWPLPRNGKPGRWVKVDGLLVPCRNGLHLCRAKDLFGWFGPAVWEAEAGRERIVHEDSKVVVRRARLVRRLCWDDRVARLFAADCAERVLPIFERERPDDDRPRRAIEAARFAGGKIDDAARDAAWDAAGAAARAAAGDAAWAARAAAGDARAAAGDAAWAAGAAAEAAARGAAWAAAGDAAWAARAAAGAAAVAAERGWQTKRLVEYLDGDRDG